MGRRFWASVVAWVIVAAWALVAVMVAAALWAEVWLKPCDAWSPTSEAIVGSVMIMGLYGLLVLGVVAAAGSLLVRCARCNAVLFPMLLNHGPAKGRDARMFRAIKQGILGHEVQCAKCGDASSLEGFEYRVVFNLFSVDGKREVEVREFSNGKTYLVEREWVEGTTFKDRHSGAMVGPFASPAAAESFIVGTRWFLGSSA
jgi:hypothetical protein